MLASEVHPTVADDLGLPQYPSGAGVSSPLDGHIMGVVTLAWLTRFPIERWGADWVTGGSIEARFRSHLSAGRRLELVADHGEDRIDVAVRDATGSPVYATGAATGAAPAPPVADEQPAGHDGLVRPTPDELGRLVLRPIEFDFVAARDLAVTDRLTDGPFWRARAWAHPAWLASAANAIVRHNVAFEDGGQWVHAGIALTLRAPVADRARIRVHGRIERLFETDSYRFAVAAIEAGVDGRPAATMRSTFVYAAALDR